MIKTDRKISILQAAEELFADKGYFSTSIADIINHANIARGTFYIYFNSKKDIFDSLLEYFLISLDQSIFRINIAPGAPDPVLQLKDNLMRIATLLQEHRNLTKIVLTYATGIDEDFDNKISSFYAKVYDLLETAISLGIQMEILRPCNPVIISKYFIGSIKEIALFFINNDNNSISIEEVVDELIQLNFIGLLIQD